ncbi:MAG: DegT/DnrJ/EryC1/StrS family aminotransferase [Cyclobacteriaceae bacterium]|nr:DegT/DnrJ/EryC1/StrS family aminotransferase [Cyclobacteriaceae bacterium]
MKPIQMVDLQGQYEAIKDEIDAGIAQVIRSAKFINGPEVGLFEKELADYLDAGHVVACANGTDALQIALMALDLPPDAEIIVPAFNYVAAAEVVALLKYKLVFADVHPRYFTLDSEDVRRRVTPKTKVIIAVHLFGQGAPMEELMKLAHEHGLYVIEDNAQSIGADYIFSDGSRKKLGTIGHIGTTSFFPSKNLGCYGDGGAVITNDPHLASAMRSIASHGQSKKYYYQRVGINSRLDTLQAAILRPKLKRLDEYIIRRREAADFYNRHLQQVDWLILPECAPYSTHVYHQYTVQVKEKNRDNLAAHLAAFQIPTMVYYPEALHKAPAYHRQEISLPVAEALTSSVISLPMHTELTHDQLTYICDAIKSYGT